MEEDAYSGMLTCPTPQPWWNFVSLKLTMVARFKLWEWDLLRKLCNARPGEPARLCAHDNKDDKDYAASGILICETMLSCL